MRIRHAERLDTNAWERMRQSLWPSPEGEHAQEIEYFLKGDSTQPAAVLIALDDADCPIGFAELSIRNWAEGCSTNRVAYLEGWFVEADWRLRGVGRALVEASMAWGRELGCVEFGSDVEWENAGSLAAHAALGFEEVERIVCFRKAL